MGRMVVIDLIDTREAVNALGDWTVTEARTSAYAEERSVSQNEFYQGMATGFKPEVKFILTNWLDYHGEEFIEYVPFMGDPDNPIRLRVLRTYNNGDRLEITCYKDIVRPSASAEEVPDANSQITD